MKEVIDGSADFTAGMYVLTTVRSEFMDHTRIHLAFPFVLVAPYGKKFSSLQKLFRPFNSLIWILIGVVFVGGFLVILGIHRIKKKHIRKIVFGENVGSSHYLNMVNVLFGVSMSKLPVKDFSRQLLATFLIFCLVIRNLYQGLLFQNMQAEDRMQPVMTIDEMIEQGFYFYMYPIYQDHTENLRIHFRYLAVFWLKKVFKTLCFQTENLRLLRTRKLFQKNS